MLWGKARQRWDESDGLITLILRLAETKKILKTSSEIITVFGIHYCLIQASQTCWTEVTSLTYLKRLLLVEDAVKWKEACKLGKKKKTTTKTTNSKKPPEL